MGVKKNQDDQTLAETLDNYQIMEGQQTISRGWQTEGGKGGTTATILDTSAMCLDKGFQLEKCSLTHFYAVSDFW